MLNREDVPLLKSFLCKSKVDKSKRIEIKCAVDADYVDFGKSCEMTVLSDNNKEVYFGKKLENFDFYALSQEIAAAEAINKKD